MATPAKGAGQTNHGAVAATEYSNSSIIIRTGPGVGTITFCLSFFVENTLGSPTKTNIAGTASHIENRAKAHGPATQAISSQRKRRPAETGVS